MKLSEVDEILHNYREKKRHASFLQMSLHHHAEDEAGSEAEVAEEVEAEELHPRPHTRT